MSDMIQHPYLKKGYTDRVIATAALAGAKIVHAPWNNQSFQENPCTLYFLEGDMGDRMWFGSRFEAAQAFLAQHDIVVD
jgi:hypothetical protein